MSRFDCIFIFLTQGTDIVMFMFLMGRKIGRLENKNKIQLINISE